MRSHAAVAVNLWEEDGESRARQLVVAVLDDLTQAQITEKDRALYLAVEMFTVDREAINADLYAALEAKGWTKGALLEAITVCSLFCFFNSWVDCAGETECTQEDHEASGRRLAQFGYAPS